MCKFYYLINTLKIASPNRNIGGSTPRGDAIFKGVEFLLNLEYGTHLIWMLIVRFKSLNIFEQLQIILCRISASLFYKYHL